MSDQLSVVEELLRMQALIDKSPPSPHHIIARYDIPCHLTRSGQPFRMWDTKGRLVWFMSRRVLDALPQTEPRDIMPIHRPLGVTYAISVILEDE